MGGFDKNLRGLHSSMAILSLPFYYNQMVRATFIFKSVKYGNKGFMVVGNIWVAVVAMMQGI